MALNVSSPLTGTAQSGFTAPTWVFEEDFVSSINGEQVAITAKGGTVPAAVTFNSPSSPFTLSWEKPRQFGSPGVPNPVTGKLNRVPMNVWKFRVRKGVTPLSGQSPQTMLGTVELRIPAGADVEDPENIRAALSALFGLVYDQSSLIGTSVVTGTL